jgi:hypothetical protein
MLQGFETKAEIDSCFSYFASKETLKQDLLKEFHT